MDSINRMAVELIDEVITAVREQLKARVAPTVVDVEDLPAGEYKTELIDHE